MNKLSGMIAGAVMMVCVSTASGGEEAPREWRYDGRLLDRSAPVSGAVDLSFRFYDAAEDGAVAGPELLARAVPVESGNFHVVLETGDFAFDPDAHWIELSVDGQVILPRQRLLRTIELDRTPGVERAGDDPDESAGVDGSADERHGLFGAPGQGAHGGGFGLGQPWDLGDPEEDGDEDEYALTAEENFDGEGDPGDAGGGTWDTRGSEYYYKRANVGVGTSNPAYPLDVRNSSRSRTLNVDNTDGSGTRYGVYARAKSTKGRGVYGYASASSGSTIGVFGRSNSTQGTGVYGLATADASGNCGVYGQNDGNGPAVAAVNTNSFFGVGVSSFVQAGTGVDAETLSGQGVVGKGTSVGVEGQASGSGGIGISGNASLIAGSGRGVVGTCASPSGYGGYFQGGNGGKALYVRNSTDANNIIEAWAGGNMDFRVISDGNVRCDGSFTGGGADFAEWVPKQREADTFESGEIVGLMDGRVTRTTSGAQQVAVISTAPAFIGNGGEAELDDRPDHALVAFVGRTPVKVRGPVAAGDFIVPSGAGDGVGAAVAPQSMTPQQLREVVGTAWEGAASEGVHLIEVSVGIDQAAASAIVIERLQEHVNDLDSRMAALEAALSRPATDVTSLWR